MVHYFIACHLSFSAGFEKECQDFLQMIQEDGDPALVNSPILDSFDSSDLSNSTHSSLLSSAELSASQSPLGTPNELNVQSIEDAISSSRDNKECRSIMQLPDL